MPCLDSHMDARFRSKLIDYIRASPNLFTNYHQDRDEEEWWSIECEVPVSRMVSVALGHEAHDHDVYLNVIGGEISEVIRAASDLGPELLK